MRTFVLLACLLPLAAAAQTDAALAAAAKEPGAVASPSGLVYRELKAGNGASPTATDKVKVHYRGTLTNGKEFDSSLGGKPAEFPLNKVIRCWTEGVQKMKVGGKARPDQPPVPEPELLGRQAGHLAHGLAL